MEAPFNFGDLLKSIQNDNSTAKEVYTEEVMNELAQDELDTYRTIQRLIRSTLENAALNHDNVDLLTKLRALAETYR